MKWNWQQKDWPSFKYNQDVIQKQEAQFLLRAGEIELFQTFDRPLSHKLLFRWHKSISKGNDELRDIEDMTIPCKSSLALFINEKFTLRLRRPKTFFKK